MGLPTPEFPLEDACSTLFNNTLYSYSGTAFQSLPLVDGATWSELSMGVAVKGGVCVKSTPVNDTSAAALYIVGGTTNLSDYKGLQRYNFAQQEWETLEPTVAVTQNRLYHGAVYLNSSDTILVYSGTQDGSMYPSSQTFTIDASEPYSVLAYQSIAPPAIYPLLMPWTESKAIYIGGSNTNTQAMIFSPSTSWVDSNATLADPLYNITSIKSIVIDGDDASKSLYTFDMTVTPNSVNRTILIDADGNPVQNAQPVTRKRDLQGGVELPKRELTVANWPAYNATLVPDTTRTTYSVAQDQSGLVVISGGNEQDVLCMFKARDNTWENATAKLASTATTTQQGLGGTSTISTTPESGSSSAPAAATTTAAAANTPFPVKILGAVLGTIVGVALILLGILLLLRWRKKRRRFSDAGHQRRSSGIPDEKDGMDFQDRGLPQMSSTRQFRGHEPAASQGSFSSMAILMGRVGHKRGGSKGNGSFESNSSSQLNKKYKNAISKPILQESPYKAAAVLGTDEKEIAKEISFSEDKVIPRPRGSRTGRRGSTRRSSGWNRYWSGGSAMNILGFGTSKRTTMEGSDTESHYSEHRQPSQVTQHSATVPPLKIGRGSEISRVVSGSPIVANSSDGFPLAREMSGQIERDSVSSTSSYNDDRNDAFSSGVPASVHEEKPWTPWGTSRGVSNTYTESTYAPTIPRSTIGNYSKDNQFPSHSLSEHPPPPNNSDMSWLNLGGDSRV
ncbi:hypothetical protein B7494_g2146 [Chlorociboria aeruginascens]|nr:hypothetical protein B7494_g2146 [Chlorociboria aeruginascens]